MADMKLITDGKGHVLGTYTFARGFVPAQRKDLRRLTEDEAMCWAMLLQNRCGAEEACEFIDEWSKGRLFVSH